MTSRAVQCPRCRFAFTAPPGAGGPLPCPMCRTPVEAAPSPPASPGPPRFGPAPSPPRPGPPGGGLAPLDVLFGEAWRSYARRPGRLLGLYLLSLALVALPIAAAALLGLAGGGGAALAVAVPFGLLGAAFAGGLGLAALTAAAVDESLGFGPALAAGWRLAWRFTGLSLLLGFVVGGASLLFLVPGVIFATWFAVAPFAALEGVGGLAALARSHALVAGRGPAVFGRLLAASVLGLVLSAVPVLGWVLSLLYAPLQLLVSALLFEELRGSEPSPPRPARAGGAVAVAALGWALLAAAGTFALTGAGAGLGEVARLGVAVLTGRGDPGAPSLAPSGPTGTPAPGVAAPDEPERAEPAEPEPVEAGPEGAPAEGQAPLDAEPGPPGGARGAAQGRAEEAPEPLPGEVILSVSSLHYAGAVLVNGVPVLVLQGEPDVTDEHHLTSPEFRRGRNAVELDVRPLDGQGRRASLTVEVRLLGETTRMLGRLRLDGRRQGARVLEFDL